MRIQLRSETGGLSPGFPPRFPQVSPGFPPPGFPRFPEKARMPNRRLLTGLALLFMTSDPMCLPVTAAAAHASKDWPSFTSRAGWTVRYPPNWQVGSCNNCTDPTAPNVFVSFFDPSTSGMVRIERLQDKPVDQGIGAWLNHVGQTAVANPRSSKHWMSLDGRRALTIRTRNPDSTASENVYVVDQSKTFFIQASPVGDEGFYPLYKRMFSSFRFETH